MIDISNEHLISLREVPRHLPHRPTGHRVHISAVYRWMTRGISGIHLESVKIGGTTYTSKEALQRFADRLSSADRSKTATPHEITLSRQKQIDKATKQVKSILGNNTSTNPSD